MFIILTLSIIYWVVEVGRRYSVLDKVPISKVEIININLELQEKLIRECLVERYSTGQYVFRQNTPLTATFQAALTRRALPLFKLGSWVELSPIRNYDLSPFSTLIEYYVTKGELPDLEKWRVDYGYRENTFLITINNTKIQMDWLVYLLLESMLIVEKTLEI